MNKAVLSEIFARVEWAFSRAESAQRALLMSRGEEKKRALEDLVVWGRCVTSVMQNLRGKLRDFDDWYKPHEAYLRGDEGMKRFYEMRSEVLKQGRLRIAEVATVLHSGKRNLEPPPGATHYIAWDQESGKWGWQVEDENGDVGKVLYDFPEDVEVVERLSFTPTIGTLTDLTVEQTANRYIEYLHGMVSELRVLVLRDRSNGSALSRTNPHAEE